MSTPSFLTLVLLALLVGCTTAGQARDSSFQGTMALETEQDLLYTCALGEASSLGLEIAHADPTSRVFQTSWSEASVERWRLTVFVRVHPRLGPGVDSVVTRQAVDSEVDPGADGPQAPAPSWSAATPAPRDDRFVTTYGEAIRSCWSERSTLSRSRRR